jgi:hypothetical protein
MRRSSERYENGGFLLAGVDPPNRSECCSRSASLPDKQQHHPIIGYTGTDGDVLIPSTINEMPVHNFEKLERYLLMPSGSARAPIQDYRESTTHC